MRGTPSPTTAKSSGPPGRPGDVPRSRFLRDVHRATLLFGGAGSGVLALVDHGSAASFALGAVLSEVSLWALERQVRWIMQSERRRSRRYLPALLLVGKYVVIGAVLYAVGRADWIRLGYLGMGVCALLIAVLACLALYVASGRAFAEEHGST